MAQAVCPTALQGVAIRITRLNAAGLIVAQAASMIESKALVLLTATPEVEAGEDFSQKNAAGEYCNTYKDPDRIKWMNHELTICGPDPEVHELLVGGDLLILDEDAHPRDGNSVGWAMPADGDDADADPVSIEVWSKAIVGGVQDALLPYYRSVYPFTNNWKLGARSKTNGVEEIIFTGGRGYDNPNWGNGPRNDWDYTSDRKYQFAQVPASDLPTPTCGAIAIPTQA